MTGINSELRKDCPMRHETGNCTPVGGFCTAVNDPICEGLHNAYDAGLYAAALRAQAEAEKNAPLTLEELREMDGERVWIERIGGRVPYDNGWATVNRENCLCRTEDGCNAFFELYGIGWLAYRRKPEETPADG